MFTAKPHGPLLPDQVVLCRIPSSSWNDATYFVVEAKRGKKRVTVTIPGHGAQSFDAATGRLARSNPLYFRYALER